MKVLTKREIQIIELLCSGKLNKEIAWELHLAEGTIKEYMFHLFKKIGAKNRTAAAMWGVTHGFKPRWVGEYEI